jgi:hypothetical protein
MSKNDIVTGEGQIIGTVDIPDKPTKTNPVANMPERISPNELNIERAELGLPPASAPKMIVKTISAKYERKFNLGEYESAGLEVSTWADIDPEQNPAQAITELQELCKAQVRKQALPILRGRKNGGTEFSELHDDYLVLERILEDALMYIQTQQNDSEVYTQLVERLNALKAH